MSGYRGRFESLLLVLFCFHAVVPFFDSPLLVDVVGTAVLVFAIAAISENRKTLVACTLLAVSLVAANLTGRWIPGGTTLVVANLLDIVFLLLVVGAILTFVFRSRDVSRQTLAGAICAYLLIGAMWADVYSVVEIAMPVSFSGSGMETVGVESARNLAASFFYFSFVTLSTLGYGDITPVTRPARNLAALEAIVGQLYLAVLVARLVGQLAATRVGRGDKETTAV